MCASALECCVYVCVGTSCAVACVRAMHFDELWQMLLNSAIILKIMMYRLRNDSTKFEMIVIRETRRTIAMVDRRPKEFRFNHWLLPWCAQFSILLQFISWKDSVENATHRIPSINVQRSATALDEEGGRKGGRNLQAWNDRKIIYYCENKSNQ